jgi:GH18 family chitinase
MENNFIDKAFEEGKDLRNILFGIQGESSKKTIERFTYKFLEALRRQDSGDLSYQLIRFYQNFEKRQIPQFFVNVLKDKSSLSQIGYAFLLGLNSNKSSSETENDQNNQSEEVENIENTEQEEE